MIMKAGSPGGGQCSAHRLAEVCDSPKRGELGRVILVVGDCVCAIPRQMTEWSRIWIEGSSTHECNDMKLLEAMYTP